jgi:nucleotide-binding universal stress UspA family protein
VFDPWRPKPTSSTLQQGNVGERRSNGVTAGTIVCGIDRSHEAKAAAQMAAALATRLGLRLVLAHVVDELRHGETLLEIAAEDVQDGIEADVRVEYGDRAEVLAQIAAEEAADLIVVGSRPRRLRDRWLRCGLARELEATTPVPILIAPPQTRRRSARRLAVAEAPVA